MGHRAIEPNKNVKLPEIVARLDQPKSAIIQGKQLPTSGPNVRFCDIHIVAFRHDMQLYDRPALT